MAREVYVCEHAGFCFGAARGVECLEKALEGDTPIYTFGPILNNDRLVDGYKKRGVRVISDVSEFEGLPTGKVIIRAHGVPKRTYEQILATGNEVIDATCPFVKRIHKIVEEQSAKGERIIVIGNPRHPEVLGIVGWSLNGATVIETKEDLMNFTADKDERLCIVAQTTFNRNKFQEFLDIFKENSYNINVMNTICDATRVRQAESEEMSKKAKMMIVIGDEKSSNSRKLYEICSENCANTYFIQDVEDIKGKLPDTNGLIGITAGASTPRYIIEEVQNYVRHDF